MKFLALSVAQVWLASTYPCLADARASELGADKKIHVFLVGSFSAEPVDFIIAGKKSSTSVTTGLAVPRFHEIDLKIEKSPALVTVQLPRLQLTNSIEIDSAKDHFLYVSVEDARLSLKRTSQARSFD